MDTLIAEFIGTSILMLLGIGVNANSSLKNTIAEKKIQLDFSKYGMGIIRFCCGFCYRSI